MACMHCVHGLLTVMNFVRHGLVGGLRGQNVSWVTAVSECESHGLRLCTDEEHANKVPCGAGCWYDRQWVWHYQNTPIWLSRPAFGADGECFF